MSSKIKDGFDTTSLNSNYHGYTVHRDYAAHFFRWGWACRFIKRNKTNVLEIGCGPDTPIIKVVGHGLGGHQPAHYVGVDLNKLKPCGTKWVTLIEEFNFNKQHKQLNKHGLFDLIVCFEVIEHMTVAEGRKLLRAAYQHLAPGGTMLLSTPVYDGVHLPTAHVHEYTIPELQKAIEKVGFWVERRHGTFMNVNEMKKVSTTEEKKLFKELSKFYSNDVLACFLAPKYPDACRNNAWVLRKEGEV